MCRDRWGHAFGRGRYQRIGLCWNQRKLATRHLLVSVGSAISALLLHHSAVLLWHRIEETVCQHAYATRTVLPGGAQVQGVHA